MARAAEAVAGVTCRPECSCSASGRCCSSSPSGSSPADGDVERLLQFVVWECRIEDLPDDVAAAAGRVAATRTVGCPGRMQEYRDPTWRVSGIPKDETLMPVDRRGFNVGLTVDRLLDDMGDSLQLVLVQRQQ